MKVTREAADRVCQGDVIRNVDFIESVTEADGILEIQRVFYPVVVVLTQDCDLEQHFGDRRDPGKGGGRSLVSTLVAPAYNAAHVYAGEHLSDLGIRSAPINPKRTDGDYLRKNERPRYHFLDFPPNTGLVPAVVDFKHYFSVNVEHLLALKNANYVCRISELYREALSSRFANYLSRIGLPVPPAAASVIDPAIP